MARKKEVHQFDDEIQDWVNPDYSKLNNSFDWTSENVLRGEATPIYIYWPHALARLQVYRPDAKLIVLLRHPVYRAYSHWRMETGRGFEKLSFEEAISLDGRKRVMDAVNGVHRVYSYVERGYYASQVKALLSIFSRQQVLFLRTDHMWSDPAASIAQVEKFLGIDQAVSLTAVPVYVVPTISAKTTGITPAARRLLDSHFRSDIVETEKRTGLILNDWLSPDYSENMPR